MALKDGPIISDRLRRHLDPKPVCPQNAEGPGPHYITHQDIKTAIPVQGIIVLLQVKEYGMEDSLPHGNDLLKQLCLDGGGPCSSTRSKSMQSVLELDGKKLPEIDDS